ncbi:BQ5605_C002g01651 [Microbotryum silenes-dioicae]|uniref:BQ5605_C002g01651 protein n=1 Tax=Microbotryum silenes-dioicae TaxID=796604 RepID=A0A2X0M3G1_9BASI|nr:BQ5605_C002g01651 [Microbotryum silenes-dioicae]
MAPTTSTAHPGAGRVVNKRPRVAQAVTTESWDDDFLFQGSSSSRSTSPTTIKPLPRTRPSPGTAAAAGTATTAMITTPKPSVPHRPPPRSFNCTSSGPSSRNVSSSSSQSNRSWGLSTPSTPATSARTSSQSSAKESPPLSLSETNGPYLRAANNASNDSLGSSWSIDPDPTLTLANSRSSPPPPMPSSSKPSPPPPVPAIPAHHMTTPRRPTRRVQTGQLNPSFVAQGIVERSDTPSWGRSGISTAEDYTEIETEEECAPRQPRRGGTRVRNWSRNSSATTLDEMIGSHDVANKVGANDMPPLSVSQRRSSSTKWKRLSGIFGSAKNEGELQKSASRNDLSDVATSSQVTAGPTSIFDSSTGLPRPHNAEFVVLGRRSRMSVDSAMSTDDEDRRTFNAVARQPHSSHDSGSTVDSAGGAEWWISSRPANTSRRSLTFAPPPPMHSRRSLDLYREIDEDGVTSMDEAADATEAETSADDRGTGKRMAYAPAQARLSVASSTTIYTNVQAASSNPGFASSAKAFGLPPMASQKLTPEVSPRSTEWDHIGADLSKKKRKLVRKRASDVHQTAGSSSTVQLDSAGINGSSISAHASMASLIDRSGLSNREMPACSPRPDPDSSSIPSVMPPPRQSSKPQTGRVDDISASPPVTKVPKSRPRSLTAPVLAVTVEKGVVVDIPDDPGWLAVEPFPLSPIKGPAIVETIPRPASRGLSPSLLRRRSSSKPTHPPVAHKKQGDKRSSSLVNLLTRSASSLPLVGKRAPSPSPSIGSSKSSSILSRKGRDKISRSLSSSVLGSTSTLPPSPSPASSSRPFLSHSQSIDKQVLPPTAKRDSFVTRARALSKGHKTSRPITPAPAEIETPVQHMDRSGSAGRSGAAPPSRPRLAEGWSFSRPLSGVSDKSEMGSTALGGSALPPVITNRKVDRVVSATREGSRPPSPFVKGHRPSLSLSAVMPGRPSSWAPPSSPLPPAVPKEPVPAKSALGLDRTPKAQPPHAPMGSGRPPSRFWDDDFASITSSSIQTTRRNSLGDLKIPQRISMAQARIEEDLERVKQFAQGIEELKLVRAQYQQLLRTVAHSARSFDIEPSHLESLSRTTLRPASQAIRRLGIDYGAWWEQADALVDLGDGTPRAVEPRQTPGSIASRRDRCVSLAPSPPHKGRWNDSAASSDENESAWGADSADATMTQRIGRRPSCSSIETSGFRSGMARRQHEMLRGVLVPGPKGASLPSRGPPSPRPTLAALHSNSAGLKGTLPFSRFTGIDGRPAVHLPPTPSKKSLRRVSRAGVSGIKEFLLRLRNKFVVEDLTFPASAQFYQEPVDSLPSNGRKSISIPIDPTLANSPRDHRSSMLRVDSEEEEDWDQASLAPSPARQAPTSSVSGGDYRGVVSSPGVERMILTTEAMPGLVLKVAEVRERCEECVERLQRLSTAVVV